MADWVGFNNKGYGKVGLVAQFHEALIIKTNQVRVGGFSGLDRRILPRATFPGRFAKFPQVVNNAGPNHRLAVLGSDHMGVALGGFWIKAAQNQHPAVGSIVMDTERMGGNRTDFGKSIGIFSRQFVKCTHGMEQIAFRSHFPADPHGSRLFQRAESGIALGKAPSATGVVFDQNRGIVHFQLAGGNGIGFPRILSGRARSLFPENEVHVGIKFIETGLREFSAGELPGQHAHCTEVSSTGIQESSQGCFVRYERKSLKNSIGFRGAGIIGTIHEFDTHIRIPISYNTNPFRMFDVIERYKARCSCRQ